jgi:hypothetical protein
LSETREFLYQDTLDEDAKAILRYLENFFAAQITTSTFLENRGCCKTTTLAIPFTRSR